jgi:serralysin
MLMGGAGNDYLDEGDGHGDLEGGPGNDILVGGLGPDAFGVDLTSGDDVIRDFTAGPGMFDHLARDLTWEDLSFENMAAGGKIIWDGGSVLIEGVQQSELAQYGFMFAEEPDLPPASRDVSGPTPERPSPMSSAGPLISIGCSCLDARSTEPSTDF